MEQQSVHLTNRWHRPGEPFNLAATVASGQAFRWTRDSYGIWWGANQNTIVAAYQQDADPDAPVLWQTFPDNDRLDLFEALFRLDVSLPELYAEWCSTDHAIRDAVQAFRGLRIMRQDPTECFFSFQCASCNTVIKIERSVRLLAQRYGSRLEPPHFYSLEQDINAFPGIAEIALADEAVLRRDLWGFRAPRVIDLANRLSIRGPGWLNDLRSATYADAHRELSSMPGIGAKVADCICLFSLDKDDAVPIDTHTRQIAVRLFHTEFAASSLTPRIYKALADSYRARYGPYAGWAQQYLFFAELRRSGDFIRP